MKAFINLLILLVILTVPSSCSNYEKLINKGYTYTMIDEPASVQKVWMPKYTKYRKKQKRYKFVKGHYRIVLGTKAYAHRMVRIRNQY